MLKQLLRQSADCNYLPSPEVGEDMLHLLFQVSCDVTPDQLLQLLAGVGIIGGGAHFFKKAKH